MPTKTEATFTGSIPENYDKYLGPVLLLPYAHDLAKRLPINGLNDVLELACGTGIMTQILRERLGETTKLVATDISADMLEIAKGKTYSKPVEWKVVDATSLPFKDNSFDVVICQFGFMFFPDKHKAAKEIFRVLRPGGRLLFNTWDKIEHNDIPRIAHSIIGSMFDENPPEFYKIPFGFYDYFVIRTILRNAGFSDIGLTVVEMKIQTEPGSAAKGCVEGNPICDEIRTRLGKDVKEAVERVERALASELGQKIARGHARAIVVGGRKAGDLPAAVKSASPRATTDQAKPKAEKPKIAKAKPKPKAKAAK